MFVSNNNFKIFSRKELWPLLANLDSLQQKHKKSFYPNLIKQKCIDEPLILKDISRTYSELALFSKTKSLACISKEDSSQKEAFTAQQPNNNISHVKCLELLGERSNIKETYSNGMKVDEVSRYGAIKNNEEIGNDSNSSNSTYNVKSNRGYLTNEKEKNMSSIQKKESIVTVDKSIDGCSNYIENAMKNKLVEPKFKSDHDFFEKRNLEPKIKLEGDFFDYDMGQNRLQRVLRAYANFDGEVGYTQGMNFIVAGLIYCLNPNNDKESVDGKKRKMIYNFLIYLLWSSIIIRN